MRLSRLITTLLVAVLPWLHGHALAADFPALSASEDGKLQQLLERTLDRLGMAYAARRGKLAVALVELSDLKHPRVAEVNGDEMMYAASLPKIGILLAAMNEVERGRLRLSDSLSRSMTDMIRVSSNTEATRVMNLVGKRRVNEILASPRFRFYDPQTNGGLWVGKEYATGQAFQRDPLHNISHGATAMQVARFYYLLETDKLLRPDLNARMKEMLSHPGIQHKFVKGLQGRGVQIFRKSGTWNQFHADSALVEGPQGRYILVALAEDTRGGDWLVSLSRSLHDSMYPQRYARAGN